MVKFIRIYCVDLSGFHANRKKKMLRYESHFTIKLPGITVGCSGIGLAIVSSCCSQDT